MTKLRDYSGELRPNLKLDNFRTDTVHKLLSLYTKLYMALDAFWYLTVSEKYGIKQAWDCDMRTWEKTTKYEMREITEQLNITGRDVVSFIKSVQLTPWFVSSKASIEVRNPNHVLLTIISCPMLEAVEREDSGKEYELCNVISPKIFRDYADFFNKDIMVRGLSLPPRGNNKDICCQWEFSLV